MRHEQDTLRITGRGQWLSQCQPRARVCTYIRVKMTQLVSSLLTSGFACQTAELHSIEGCRDA